MNVCVIGTGYVGLVTGTMFADLGNDVVCVDKMTEKIDMLKRGKMPIYEPGLEEMVDRNVKEGRLTFSTDLGHSVQQSEVIFICVGTPPKDSGETDLSYVEAVAKEIAPNITSYKIVVNKSTVPIGTGDLVRSVIERGKKSGVEFDVVSNPEFLREGSAINDSLFPDRIVIGAPRQNVAMKLLELYAPIERPMLITDVESAELIKYASNAFLATKISFINSIADICERAGGDISLVAKGMGADRRIGPEFLNAGLGYGGSCFPKDTLSLLHTSKTYDARNSILEAVIDINSRRVPRFVENVVNVLGGLKGKTLAILGLAFKPNTDDLRDAKSLEIIEHLLNGGASVRAYDPVAMDGARAIIPNIHYASNAYDAATGADAIIIVTEWNEFKLLNLEKVRPLMKQPVIFDGRNIYKPELIAKMGFDYYSIGKKPLLAADKSTAAAK